MECDDAVPRSWLAVMRSECDDRGETNCRSVGWRPGINAERADLLWVECTGKLVGTQTVC